MLKIKITKQEKSKDKYEYIANYREVTTRHTVIAEGEYSYKYTVYDKTRPKLDADGNPIPDQYYTKDLYVKESSRATGTYNSQTVKRLVEKTNTLVNTVLEEYKTTTNDEEGKLVEKKYKSTYDLYCGNRDVTKAYLSNIKIEASDDKYKFDKKDNVFKVAYAIVVKDDDTAVERKTVNGPDVILDYTTVSGTISTIPGSENDARLKGQAELSSALSTKVSNYVKGQTCEEIDSRDEQIAQISEGYLSVAYEISDTVQIYRVYDKNDMLAAFAMNEWMEDIYTSARPFYNNSVNDMYEKVFSSGQVVSHDQALLLKSALFYQDARLRSGSRFKYLLAVNCYYESLGDSARTTLRAKLSSSAGLYDFQYLPEFEHYPPPRKEGRYYIKDASGNQVDVSSRELVESSDGFYLTDGTPVYSKGGTINWNVKFVFAHMMKGWRGDTDNYQWATDCCGYIRLSNAIAGIKRKDVGYYGNVGGSYFGTKENMDANLMPGDVINTDPDGHVIMFMYSEDTDDDGEPDLYHISDQQAVDKTMRWDEAGKCLRMNTSDTRSYPRAFRIVTDIPEGEE